jgi:hypothetical protein
MHDEWSIILSGWKTANERESVITSWFIAISAVLLVLYLTVPKPNADKEWFDYYFEAIASYFTNCFITLVFIVGNISPQTNLSR